MKTLLDWFETFLGWDWIKKVTSKSAEPKAAVIVPPANATPSNSAATPDAPWMEWMFARVGWGEEKNESILAQLWKYTNHKARTIIGAENAWCAMAVNAALIESGYKGNGRADAVSFVKYGTACEDKFGCIIVIEHSNGHYHVAFRGHAGLLGGNQDNMIHEKAIGHSDKIIATRWPVKA